MINKMTTMGKEDLSRLKNQKPFSLEEERANVFIIGKEEIGLLDIVVLDGIVKSEACSQ